MQNEVDSKFSEKRKDISVSSWFYQWAAELMVRQILWGFEEDLYEASEYHYVAYHLEHLLHICEKNSTVFMTRVDAIDRSISVSSSRSTQVSTRARSPRTRSARSSLPNYSVNSSQTASSRRAFATTSAPSHD
jgi:hypothetical protein